MQHVTVLVAEDEPTLRYLAKRQLKALGLQCDLVENGKSAVEKASTNTYGMILMDIQMPVMNGLEATTAIRKHETQSNHHTPIVAMTANPDKSLCLDAGMDDFIFKPVLLADLNRVIKRWIGTPNPDGTK
jgi:two-component system, sensor histidine kinase and response regulator